MKYDQLRERAATRRWGQTVAPWQLALAQGVVFLPDRYRLCFEAGWDAYVAGKRCACPYHQRQTQRRRVWEAGWAWAEKLEAVDTVEEARVMAALAGDEPPRPLRIR